MPLIFAVAHGGYILAILLNATLTHFESEGQGTPLALDISYLSPSSAGPCRIDIKLLKPGRTSSVAQVTLWQPNSKSPRVHAIATMTSATSGPTLQLQRAGSSQDWSLPPPHLCSKFVIPAFALPPKGGCMLDNVDYLAADNGESYRGVAESRGWCRLPGRMCDDWRATGIFLDWIVPPIQNLPKGTLPYACWVPTLEIHAVFHQPPREGNMSFQARHVAISDINDGRHVVDGEVRDEEGRLLISMRQLAIAVPWAKNASQGKKASKSTAKSADVQSNL
ncbi:thioesterase-like superfamily-domain-containing protein [Blyttiomyces helicus]|uniref:Thioesterase-like superfamily-domain-containing protein n=1 Tax=Blyttiomyces helicus TaxID=388810 RepID=A0A4P9W7S1_9FUNG|nr:thioesterase-like superfamily-domain-containing protein [Blyttiomyces helicus]|eukprot:RKO88424.1 thioesterase-like superfamily-domain-containing protein [Blyttiomyces helicus]